MDLDDARRRLDEERTRLEGLREGFDDLHNESEEASLSELSSLDQHQADVGTETFNRERDLSILERVEAEREAVPVALLGRDPGGVRFAVPEGASSVTITEEHDPGASSPASDAVAEGDLSS